MDIAVWTSSSENIYIYIHSHLLRPPPRDQGLLKILALTSREAVYLSIYLSLYICSSIDIAVWTFISEKMKIYIILYIYMYIYTYICL